MNKILKFFLELVGSDTEPEKQIEKRSILATVSLKNGKDVSRVFHLRKWSEKRDWLIPAICEFDEWKDAINIDIGNGVFVPREQVLQFSMKYIDKE